mmetsp:Transcript_1316/g.2800  ORF Transcript_1316/g.2800 Transcript_1316/m.2800 type:complete len:214 (-) Transcript_1316:113-754(-)
MASRCKSRSTHRAIILGSSPSCTTRCVPRASSPSASVRASCSTRAVLSAFSVLSMQFSPVTPKIMRSMSNGGGGIRGGAVWRPLWFLVACGARCYLLLGHASCRMPLTARAIACCRRQQGARASTVRWRRPLVGCPLHGEAFLGPHESVSCGWYPAGGWKPAGAPRILIAQGSAREWLRDGQRLPVVLAVESSALRLPRTRSPGPRRHHTAEM